MSSGDRARSRRPRGSARGAKRSGLVPIDYGTEQAAQDGDQARNGSDRLKRGTMRLHEQGIWVKGEKRGQREHMSRSFQDPALRRMTVLQVLEKTAMKMVSR